jgi:radical SAM superfamily enzyme YgiQ (UPF0313 family)
MIFERKITIYLGDLVHDFLGGGSYMFPLNIGLIASYTKKIFGNQVEIELFKYPGKLIERIRNSSPHVLGLSNYTWNTHLSREISNLAKSLDSKTMVVWGGPNINHNENGYREFFINNPTVDSYIINEGEMGFVNLINECLSKGLDLKRIKEHSIDGCVFYDEGTVITDNRLDRISNLDEIPSPYLTGILDDFFQYDLIPIIETNRGCPYQCTYCAQGLVSQYKVKLFDMDRVLEELNYIAEKVIKTNLLCFADANFGITARDNKLAEHIRTLQSTKSYPRRCIINWDKTSQSVELAEIMGESAYLVSSLQSIDQTVLRNIKRGNIGSSRFKEIIDRVNEAGGVSGTEIILALPGETKESHLNSLRKLFDWGVSYIICYNCLIINGSELALSEQRDRFNIHTKFRLIDSAFGSYDNILSFECEEGVRSTSTMSEEEILFFRPIHWLIQFFWNYRCYFDVLQFINLQGMNPVDFILAVIGNLQHAKQSVRTIFDDFRKESISEWFSTAEGLRIYYSEPENFETLTSGGIGKMNGKYTWRAILECKIDFDSYIQQIGIDVLSDYGEVIKNLVLFSANLLPDFSNEIDFDATHKVVFGYDILKWRENRYKEALKEKETTYMFYLSEEKKEALEILINQYNHTNKNVTMRKMSEHMRVSDLYYDVRPV